MFLLLLNKPKGITSRQACEIVKSKLNVKKAGHSGTLDLNAEGLLIICLDKAVKAMPFFENLDKTYKGVMHLHKQIDKDELENAVSKFVGEIIQKPPVKSRVKRVERKRFVEYFKIESVHDRDVYFETKVQAGTYIRKLVDDIGKLIGGAHLKYLKRIKIGKFNVENACDIDKIDEKCKIELEKCIDHVKKIYVKDDYVEKIMKGSPVYFGWIERYDNVKKGDKVAIFSSKIIGIGIALFDSEMFIKNKIVVKTDRIF
ncbi:MAG: hypothetical protein QXM68_01070 [Candidatus Aenigmatarchaeota archaeon]|nr:hypothetical protein [Candidatus Aenigmarchaeota archaeon]